MALRLVTLSDPDSIISPVNFQTGQYELTLQPESSSAYLSGTLSRYGARSNPLLDQQTPTEKYLWVYGAGNWLPQADYRNLFLLVFKRQSTLRAEDPPRYLRLVDACLYNFQTGSDSASLDVFAVPGEPFASGYADSSGVQIETNISFIQV